MQQPPRDARKKEKGFSCCHDDDSHPYNQTFSEPHQQTYNKVKVECLFFFNFLPLKSIWSDLKLIFREEVSGH